MDLIIEIVLVAAAMVVLAAGYAYYMSAHLRTHHVPNPPGLADAGPLTGASSLCEMESVLDRNCERMETPCTRPLPEAQQDDFAARWRSTQARFVDDPRDAVLEAAALVEEVRTARGYPIADWLLRADAVLVDRQDAGEARSAADRIARPVVDAGSETEALRQAMRHFHALFDELMVAEPAAVR